MAEPIIAVLITYFPVLEMYENVLSYYNKVSEILIIDNTDVVDKNSSLFFDKVAVLENVTIIINEENIGIAQALNTAIEFARNKRYKWLLSMDQDSRFEQNQIINYLRCFQKIKSNTVGMIGISITQQNTATTQFIESCEVEQVDTVITSGSILNIEAVSSNNILFDESLFIDGVDDDMCLKLKKQNYDILRFKNIFFQHSLGQDVEGAKLGLKGYRNLHSPVRMYYITRNYLLLSKRYAKCFPEKSKEYKKALLNRIKNNILFNSKRFSIISNVALGLIHYYTNRLGKK